jgi:alpha/beta superfamily hydrolase
VTPQALVIAGPAGTLEAVLEEPVGVTGCAVICHPHPLQGGTLHNKVVHTLARAFQELGFAALRFNYRGVGASAGSYGDAVGETDDALAVAAWARARYAPAPSMQMSLAQFPLALAGFSFGGAVAFKAAVTLAPALLITVAPAVDRVAVADSAHLRCPWLIVQGAADEVVAAERVQAWAAGFVPPPDMALLPGVGHFFHGALNELRAAAVSFAGQHLGQLSGAKKSPVL